MTDECDVLTQTSSDERESMRHYAGCHVAHIPGVRTDGHLLQQHSLIDVDTCRHLTHLAADRTCRLIAFEERHLTVPSFLEAMFEAVQGCCDCEELLHR